MKHTAPNIVRPPAAEAWLEEVWSMELPAMTQEAARAGHAGTAGWLALVWRSTGPLRPLYHCDTSLSFPDGDFTWLCAAKQEPGWEPFLAEMAPALGGEITIYPSRCRAQDFLRAQALALPWPVGHLISPAPAWVRASLASRWRCPAGWAEAVELKPGVDPAAAIAEIRARLQ